MNAKLTAENNPVWVSPKISTEWTRSNQIAHEGERRAEIFVVLLRIVSVKRVGFLMIDGGGGGRHGVIGLQWIKELVEGGMKTGLRSPKGFVLYIEFFSRYVI